MPRPRFLLLLCLYLGTGTGLAQENEANQDRVREIVNKMREHLVGIRSYEFLMTRTTTGSWIEYMELFKKAQEQPYFDEKHNEIVSDRARTQLAYREGRFVLRASGESLVRRQQWNRHSAFDGKTLQRFTEATKNLTLSKPPDGHRFMLGLNPITMPFGFLGSAETHVSDINVGKLTDQRIWDGLAEKAKYLGRERVSNHDCDVLEFPRTGLMGTSTIRVYAAIDWDYYPVKTVVISKLDVMGHVRREMLVKSEFLVEDSILVPTRSRKVRVATLMDQRSKDAGDSVIQRMKFGVDVGIRINPELPDSTFVIARDQAERVIDLR